MKLIFLCALLLLGIFSLLKCDVYRIRVFLDQLQITNGQLYWHAPGIGINMLLASTAAPETTLSSDDIVEALMCSDSPQSTFILKSYNGDIPRQRPEEDSVFEMILGNGVKLIFDRPAKDYIKWELQEGEIETVIETPVNITFNRTISPSILDAMAGLEIQTPTQDEFAFFSRNPSEKAHTTKLPFLDIWGEQFTIHRDLDDFEGDFVQEPIKGTIARNVAFSYGRHVFYLLRNIWDPKCVAMMADNDCSDLQEYQMLQRLTGRTSSPEDLEAARLRHKKAQYNVIFVAIKDSMDKNFRDVRLKVLEPSKFSYGLEMFRTWPAAVLGAVMVLLFLLKSIFF